ncbi:TolB protein precursor [Fimbriimonas ginsengisoli Gsoil 348]|uniref:TolB protein n=1 Tax=Fimbriimonas ginsengisoli Gsoil 348 TaxID=661478 RepID=A0A068NZ86_FIMGI|nr:TolB protein precursor [Fimbriimonas ginsengisoli Gsoil 348]
MAPSSGGKAVPLTNHVEMDDNPIWSPDGKYVAFASNRSGNWDVYIVPAGGGQTRRLTYHSGSDIPSDWSPDGKTILIRTTRDDSNNGFYTIDVTNGRANRLMLDMMPVSNPRFLPDGKSIVYNRFGFPWVRSRYQGSAAAQLWRYDLTTQKREKIRDTGFQHLWPNPFPDGKSVYTITVTEKTPSTAPIGKSVGKNVDNVNRTPNVYAVAMNGGARRLTSFIGAPARFLTAASKSDAVAFEDDGDVYLMAGGKTPQKIALTASIDDKTTQEERLVLTNGAEDAALSPKGDKFVVQVRSELWLVPTKKGKGPNADDAVQLTDWAGTDEQPLWAPDNKTLFFVSDRNGAERLYSMNTETKAVTAITNADADVEQLRLTPDKTKVSFWMTGKDGGLFTVPVIGGTPTRVISHPGDSKFYNWSPDGRYVAYSETLLRSGYYYWESTQNIYVFDTTTGKSTNITKLSAQHTQPTFTPDGKYLLFRSNRSGDAVYLVALHPEDVPTTELDLKYTKPTGPVKVDIDFDDIESRPRQFLNMPVQSEILVDPADGALYFLNSGDLWKAPFNGDEPRKVTNSGGFNAITWNDDQTKVVALRSGLPAIVEIHQPGTPVNVTTFRADWTHDLRKEREAAFNEFWRTYNRRFYDPNFHGRNWTALRDRYRKYLPSIGHRNEMATVLNMLVGELESSHSEVSAAPGNPSSQTSAHLGFTFDYSYPGPGIKIKDVPARSPGSYAKSKLSPGEIVLKINGKDVLPDEVLYRDVLNEQVGRELTLQVQGADGKTREVKYRAISSGAFAGIVQGNRLEARRKYVEEKSGGRLTYVHIAGMGEGEFQRFNQQVWQYAEGKKGLIIDVRNNGGGNTSDRIIDVLERQPNSYYQVRDEPLQLGPGQALGVPMVVMMAESSYSNAEMFPAAMKSRKLATLVGRPTPGYVIYTGGGRLVDGTSIRLPGTGAYRLDGTPLEDNGVIPDYDVQITPEEYFAGKDPQLDKAIEVLMSQTK